MKDVSINDIGTIDRENFWFRAKQRYLSIVIKGKNNKILDIGCGSGGNMMDVIKNNPDVVGVDISDASIENCLSKGLKAVKMDLEADDISNIGIKPDYITALDFIEHIKDPIKLLSKINKSAPESAIIVITVPAYEFLWSDWDLFMGHVKRYSKNQIKYELEKSGWNIVRISYIHSFLVIPAIIQRKIVYPIKKFIYKKKMIEEKFYNPSIIFNWMLKTVYNIEYLLYYLKIPVPFGLSIMAVAEKNRNV